MARYRGPRARISRRYREPIFGKSKALQRKNYPPGVHGRTKRRRQSEYAIQLAEKQKARYSYGLLERQFYNLFRKASRKSGITGENLFRLLESRLDNLVYRMGISTTRRSARQLVSHKHIVVNDKVVNIPSYSVSPGDSVGVRERSKSLQVVKDSLLANNAKYPWLDWDPKEMSGKYLSYPEREDIPENIKEQLIVELYSK